MGRLAGAFLVFVLCVFFIGAVARDAYCLQTFDEQGRRAVAACKDRWGWFVAPVALAIVLVAFHLLFQTIACAVLADARRVRMSRLRLLGKDREAHETDIDLMEAARREAIEDRSHAGRYRFAQEYLAVARGTLIVLAGAALVWGFLFTNIGIEAAKEGRWDSAVVWLFPWVFTFAWWPVGKLRNAVRAAAKSLTAAEDEFLRARAGGVRPTFKAV